MTRIRFRESAFPINSSGETTFVTQAVGTGTWEPPPVDPDWVIPSPPGTGTAPKQFVPDSVDVILLGVPIGPFSGGGTRVITGIWSLLLLPCPAPVGGGSASFGWVDQDWTPPDLTSANCGRGTIGFGSGFAQCRSGGFSGFGNQPGSAFTAPFTPVLQAFPAAQWARIQYTIGLPRNGVATARPLLRLLRPLGWPNLGIAYATCSCVSPCTLPCALVP